ncbi:hypothetical protein [Paucibacter sp. DJ2R-2]|uniref:hypothetical protein n=1 Tax=Paucibacter sp. DJ2R-2 TaxID=2893558 RepID=UPI0021E480BF|nr:hypothetical protein [Paucibacter sp. DJ2R-2]MCV2421794.1 hypothetical protein [Paucibacter sp. DJ4R-1]MCV2438499.1 hypothetical protein [Paucibacter sp. DJ2R-2]
MSDEEGYLSRPGFSRYKRLTYPLGDTFLAALQSEGEQILRTTRPNWRVPDAGVVAQETRRAKLAAKSVGVSLDLTSEESAALAKRLDVDLLFVFRKFFMDERGVPSGFGLRFDSGTPNVRSEVLLYSGMSLVLFTRSGERLVGRFSQENVAKEPMERYGLTTELEEITKQDVLTKVRSDLLTLAINDLAAAMARHGYSNR